MEGKPCYCDSGKGFDLCCGAIISGKKKAATAQELMRSRYSAFIVGDNKYILKTWHISNRPVNLQKDEDEKLEWLPLKVIKVEDGEVFHESGIVEFSTGYRENGKTFRLHEKSNFIKEDGNWLYVNGEMIDDSKAKAEKVGRNDPCLCGSGKKYKKCCGK